MQVKYLHIICARYVRCTAHIAIKHNETRALTNYTLAQRLITPSIFIYIAAVREDHSTGHEKRSVTGVFVYIYIYTFYMFENYSRFEMQLASVIDYERVSALRCGGVKVCEK